MKINKNIIILIVLLIIVFIPINSYAEETWDDFYLRVQFYDWVGGKDTNGNPISSDDAKRMAAGPNNIGNKDKDKLGDIGYCDYITPDCYGDKQTLALAYITSLNQANARDPQEPGVDTSITGVDQKKAKELEKEIKDMRDGGNSNPSNMTTEELKKWINKIDDYKIASGGNTQFNDKRGELNSELTNRTGQGDYSDTDNQTSSQDLHKKNPIIYNNPEITDSTKLASSTVEDVMNDADEFMNKGDLNSDGEKITPLGEDMSSLQNFSKTLSTILLIVGIAISVIMGGILGIKFMIGSLEEKAQIQQLILPYIVGCVVVFGAFAIWNLAVTLLSDI